MIAIAGDHVTNDVAVALRTPTQFAEEIKIKHGAALTSAVDPTETLQVPSVAKRPPKQIHKKALAQVVAARYEELFALVQAEIRRSGFEDLISAGIVLTGGASKVVGAVELAESVFKMPVRLGAPQNIHGLMDVRENPCYSTAVGLLMHGYQLERDGVSFNFDRGMSSMWGRMKNWFHGNF